MINLFEYQNKEDCGLSDEKLNEFESFLDDIWKTRNNYESQSSVIETKIEQQRFVQILHKNKQLKSNKYVGVIKYEDEVFNFLPKIFYEQNKKHNMEDVRVINLHILWWLKYCGKIHFPNYLTNLETTSCDFFDILIYLFSNYTKNLLSSLIYQKYEEIENELSFIKGRVDFSKYINENISKGKWHKINCTFDSYDFDNSLNRVIKYVSKLLLSYTHNVENKTNLREIIMILDEVRDTIATPEDCGNIRFNPLFENYNVVRDYCLLFLTNSISFSYKNELKLFAFLLPMNSIFEGFITGFIEKEIPEIALKSQVTTHHLDTEKKFELRPDLILEYNDHKIIADAKYKIILNETNQQNKISVSDLYQVVSYSIRFEINHVILFYPNTINNLDGIKKSSLSADNLSNKSRIIKIKNEYLNDNILVKIVFLPIINDLLFNVDTNIKQSLDTIFNTTKDTLKQKILSEVSLFSNEVKYVSLE